MIYNFKAISINGNMSQAMIGFDVVIYIYSCGYTIYLCCLFYNDQSLFHITLWEWQRKCFKTRGKD